MKRDLRSTKPAPLPDVDPQAFAEAQNAVDHYSSMNEAQLMQELQGFRESGAMNDAALNSMASQISPLLTPEQQTRLSALLSQLKQ